MAPHGGGLKSTSINGVKMYTVSSNQQFLAAWLNPKKKRSLRKDNEYMKRIELVQDLRFETATTKIKATPDGEFLIASGIYPPQVKVYELQELSLKFERHLISEIIDFQILSDDYSKIAFLCADRSVCLHAKYGSHYSLRIPRVGRDIVYDCWSCDLLCAASSPDIYRINLDQGRFLSSLNTQSPALNVVSRSELHGLVACGGEDGAVECFDMRTKSSIARINAVAPTGDTYEEVTSMAFEDDGGFLMAIGSSTGKVLIYDLRSSYPVRVKDHMYGSSILDIKWHHTLNSERAKLITTDNHIVRIWDPETGEGLTSIEPAGGKINDTCVFSESGLVVLALDSSQIPSYFIPALGNAPKWCSYLENLTEELEEGAEATIYDDYKFVTKEDLEKLNLTNLIGTNLLRACMHGFFIDYRLYKKAQSLANPFEYDSYIEQRNKEKLAVERASRITIKKRLPKINRKLASRLLENEEIANEKKDVDDAVTKSAPKKRKDLGSEILHDPRFSAMFEDEAYEIDEKSSEYRALHPMPSTKQPSLLEEHFEAVLGVDGNDSSASDSAEERSSRDKRVPRLYEVKDERHADAFSSGRSLGKEGSLSLGERHAQDSGKIQRGGGKVQFGCGGLREISFVTRNSKKYKEDDGEKKRGVHSLPLRKSHESGFRGGRGGRGRGGRSGRSRGRGRGWR